MSYSIVRRKQKSHLEPLMVPNLGNTVLYIEPLRVHPEEPPKNPEGGYFTFQPRDRKFSGYRRRSNLEPLMVLQLSHLEELFYVEP